MGRSITPSVFGSLAAASSSENTIVTLTGRDSFAKGDPVFLDTQLGEVVSANTAPAPEVFSTGIQNRVLQNIVQSGTSYAGSACAAFGDGSYVVFQSMSSLTGDVTHRVVMNHYDPHGTLISQNSTTYSSVNPNDWTILAAPITPDFIAVVFRTSTAGGNLIGRIINNNLAVAQGFNIDLTAGTEPVAITPTSDGFLLTTNNGIFRCKLSDGTSTKVVATVITYVAENMTDGSDCKGKYVSNWGATTPWQARTDMFGISSGGFGSVTAISGGSIRYDRFNSDGTVRGSTTIATGVTGANKTIMAQGTSGNIFWAAHHSGGVTWGIISDAGATVKAATLIATADTVGISTYHLHCIKDANGDFYFTWGSSTGTVLNSNYVGATTGTAKAGFPRTNATLAGPGNRLYRLSTGIFNVMGRTTNMADTKYSFILNDGTLFLNDITLRDCEDNTYSTTGLIAATVYNDKVFMWNPNTPATTGDFTGVLTVIGSGGIVVSGYVTTNYSGATDVTPVIYVDDIDIKVFIGNGVLRFRTSDYSPLGGQNLGLTQYPTTGASRFVVVKVGKTYVLTHSCVAQPWVTSANPWATANILGAEKRSFLGIAVTDSNAGGPVAVMVKGTAQSTWSSVTATFDQTAATPPGNKGAVLGKVAILKGL